MKKKVIYIFITIFFGSLVAAGLSGLQGQRLSKDINNLYRRILNDLPPAHKNKVHLVVKNYEQKISSLDRNQNYYSLAERSIQNFLPAESSIKDMSEAVFVVIVQATKDMDDDIRMIMEEIKAMTAAKQKMRELIKDLNRWISEEMSNQPDTEDVNLEKVTGGGEVTPKKLPLSRQKIHPKMKTTPNYKVKYYKSLITKPNPKKGTLTLTELKKKLKQSEEELKILLKMEQDTKEALRSLTEKRDGLFKLILDLSKK
jgi:hypothetical protein